MFFLWSGGHKSTPPICRYPSIPTGRRGFYIAAFPAQLEDTIFSEDSTYAVHAKLIQAISICIKHKLKLFAAERNKLTFDSTTFGVLFIKPYCSTKSIVGWVDIY